MKTRKATMLAAVAVVLWAMPSNASWVFRFPDGERVGYWDDAARWTNNSGAHKVPTGADAGCSAPGTIYVTNAVPYVWAFSLNALASGDPLTLHFKEGGTTRYPTSSGGLSDGWSRLEVGCSANTRGIVQIDAGATYAGGLYVGVKGSGIVTNRGTIKYSSAIEVGSNAGGTGRLVCCNGGKVELRWQKDLYVGRQGRGELVVTNTTFTWSRFSAQNGDIVVGESSAGGRITVEEGGLFKGFWTYLGGRDAGAAGIGELVLRGGNYHNDYENGAANVNFFVGMCPTADGGVDAASRGVIRGYGRFVTGESWKMGSRGIHLALGHGEIVGDGEGDESHILDLHSGSALYFVSNAVPESAAETTSGWRAVNKGLVTMPAYLCHWDGSTWNDLVAYPGCALEKGVDNQLPDLVNAVRIRVKNAEAGQDKCFGVAVLAPDRTDAYTNSLPAGCNVLSVHKMGGFRYAHQHETKASLSSANVAIRYDQTKIQKADSRLELWRYVAADGTWSRLVRLEPGERPAGKVIAMPDGASIARVDETYNLGTFAVVERELRGGMLIIR